MLMNAIQWSLAGMIVINFLNSPLIRSRDGVVDLTYVSAIPHQSNMIVFL